METLNLWFAVSVLIYLGLLAGLWWFWYPRDPLRRRREDGTGLRQAVAHRQFHPQPRPEDLYLIGGETLLHRSDASLYRARGEAPTIGGAVRLAGGGWLFGAQRNRPGYNYQETGTLYLTNDRLLFVGPRQSYCLPLSDLIRIAHDDAWLTLWSSHEPHAIRFRLGHADLWHQAIDLVQTRSALAS